MAAVRILLRVLVLLFLLACESTEFIPSAARDPYSLPSCFALPKTPAARTGKKLSDHGDHRRTAIVGATKIPARESQTVQSALAVAGLSPVPYSLFPPLRPPHPLR